MAQQGPGAGAIMDPAAIQALVQQAVQAAIGAIVPQLQQQQQQQQQQHPQQGSVVFVRMDRGWIDSLHHRGTVFLGSCR